MSRGTGSSRRRFLRDAGLLIGGSALASRLPPLETLAKIATEAVFSRATASIERERFFLNINFFGAPNRWVFDHWLRTKPGQNIIGNASIATRMGGGSTYDHAIYETVDYKGVQVTPMWMTSVVGANGTRPLSELLDHLIVVRGYGTGIDGHPTNLLRQTRPLNSLGSTSGYLAEQSKTLLRAVQYPASGITGYASEKGLGLTMLHDRSGNPAHNLADDLLFPFGARAGLEGVQSLRVRYDEVIEKVRFALNQRGPASSSTTVAADNESALRMIQKGLNDLISVWPSLYAKYERIMIGTLRQRDVPGFSDKPVVCPADDGSGDSPYAVDVGAERLQLQPGFDLRQVFDSAQMVRTIQGFAMAEFVLTHKLSATMEIPFVSVGNLSAQFRRPAGAPAEVYPSPATRNWEYNSDQHGTGSFASTYMNAAIFRALSAGLLELFDRLKATRHGAGQLFDHTVVQLLQDFGRSPRTTGGGADHGWDNMICSVLTGLHRGGPRVVGNISHSQTYADIYGGTIGYKAPVRLDGRDVVPSPLHLASSMASLLGLHHNPWINLASPLFSESNGVVSFHTGDDIV